jgi:hypothetical protein
VLEVGLPGFAELVGFGTPFRGLASDSTKEERPMWGWLLWSTFCRKTRSGAAAVEDEEEGVALEDDRGVPGLGRDGEDDAIIPDVGAAITNPGTRVAW